MTDQELEQALVIARAAAIETVSIAMNIGKSTYNYRDHDFVITNPLVHEALTQGENAVFPLDS